MALTSAEGRTTTYRVERLSSGEIRRRRTDPTGAQAELLIGTDGRRTLTYPDGTVATLELGPDPRWGMLAPVATTQTVTTPGGRSGTLTAERTVQLADPDDIFSLITQTDTVTSNGRPYTNTYDAGLRQFTRRSPAGREMVSTIDELGRVRSVQLDPALAPVTYAYDVQGPPTEIAQGTQRWTYTYDALSRPITRTDAVENQLQFAYDDADRLTQVTLASGRTYNYSYDVNGNVVQIIMPSNAVHDLGYTSLNLDAGYTPPDNASLSRSYNLDRQWTSTLLPSGRTVDRGYDSAVRPTGLSYPEAATSYTYADTTDRASELLRNPTGAGTAQSIGFSYDGNLVTEMIWSGGPRASSPIPGTTIFSWPAWSLPAGPTRSPFRSPGISMEPSPATLPLPSPATAPSGSPAASGTVPSPSPTPTTPWDGWPAAPIPWTARKPIRLGSPMTTWDASARR